MNHIEIDGECEPNQLYIKSCYSAGRKSTETYAFNHVFGDKNNQMDVYQECASPIIQSFLEVYNGILFAYGQIGIDTMEGTINNEVNKGNNLAQSILEQKVIQNKQSFDQQFGTGRDRGYANKLKALWKEYQTKVWELKDLKEENKIDEKEFIEIDSVNGIDGQMIQEPSLSHLRIN